MMTVARGYPFYTTLDINPESYKDIRDRLKKQDLLDKYKVTDPEDREVIVFGSTGLRSEMITE